MDKAKKDIVNLLIFKERFEDISAEVGGTMNEKMLTALMRELIEDGYVLSYVEQEDGSYKQSLGHDADDMTQYVYQASAKGINALQE